MKASKIQELRERRRKIIIAGGEDKIKARHEKGLLTARERLERSLSAGNFSGNRHAYPPLRPTFWKRG